MSEYVDRKLFSRARVSVVDVTSEEGFELTRNLNLRDFPAYVAMRHRMVLQVQQGGTVDEFVRSVKSGGLLTHGSSRNPWQ